MLKPLSGQDLTQTICNVEKKIKEIIKNKNFRRLITPIKTYRYCQTDKCQLAILCDTDTYTKTAKEICP